MNGFNVPRFFGLFVWYLVTELNCDVAFFTYMKERYFDCEWQNIFDIQKHSNIFKDFVQFP